MNINIIVHVIDKKNGQLKSNGLRRKLASQPNSQIHFPMFERLIYSSFQQCNYNILFLKTNNKPSNYPLFCKKPSDFIYLIKFYLMYWASLRSYCRGGFRGCRVCEHPPGYFRGVPSPPWALHPLICSHPTRTLLTTDMSLI